MLTCCQDEYRASTSFAKLQFGRVVYGAAGRSIALPCFNSVMLTLMVYDCFLASIASLIQHAG